MKRGAWALCGLCLAVPSIVLAVSTRTFTINTAEAFEKGKFEAVLSHSDGKLLRGPSTERVAIEGVPVAYASAVGPDGDVYVGTGSDGKIMRVGKDGAKPFADTNATLITSLVFHRDTLYAATLPKGRIFAIDHQGKFTEFVKLEGAEHVWAIAYDDKRSLLWAATGPEGKLFSIDASGKAQVKHDDVAEHLLSLALDEQGRVLTGTSNGARLVRTEGDKSSVLFDFSGQELTALDVRGGMIAVASNDFPDQIPTSADHGKDGSTRLKRPKPGKGKLFVVTPDGNVDELYSTESAHIAAVEIDPSGKSVFAGLGQDGRIVRAELAGGRALVIDVDERQVAALHLNARVPHFLTSDGVALYRVTSDKSEGTWTSAVLDAKFLARFGELTFRGKGPLKLQTRSGNTETPDATWTEFSTPMTAQGPITSPEARFLQVRATLGKDAELYALDAYYLPRNQAARVSHVREKASNRPKDNKDPTASKIDMPPSTIGLTWDVANPDEDRLRYRLSYRREDQNTYLPMQREHEALEGNDYNWETRAVPDGVYRVRVEASDEFANPNPFVRKAEAISAPILVDNHPPILSELKIDKGTLRGRISDSLGPITAIDVSIDNNLYAPVFSDDQLFDTREERFSYPLSGLGKGPHMITVRGTDAGGNFITQSLEYTVDR